MRLLLAALALGVCAGLPQASSEDWTPSQPFEQNAARFQWSGLLQRLGVNLLSKAYAAECLQEGETCATNDQCCPGLECTGGPPATCATED
jgi:hypothetical protein